MKLECGCYVDDSGRKIARCPLHSGNTNDTYVAWRRYQYEISKASAVTSRKHTFLRDSLRDGKVRSHKQSEGGP